MRIKMKNHIRYFILIVAVIGLVMPTVKTDDEEVEMVTIPTNLSAKIVYGSGRVFEVDALNPDESEFLRKRPHAQEYEGIGSARVLNLVNITAGVTPCLYKKYLEFYTEIEYSNASTLQILMNTTIMYTDDPRKFYFYDPEDLCLEVEMVDRMNHSNIVLVTSVDIYKFDCSIHGTCQCGLYMSQIDPNMTPLYSSPQNYTSDIEEKQYFFVNGLNRKLVAENGTCVSNMEGHCSLDSSKLEERLACKSQFDCVEDDSFGPKLKNMKTKEVYGVCLPKKLTDPFKEDVIHYTKLKLSSSSYNFGESYKIVTGILIVGEFLLQI